MTARRAIEVERVDFVALPVRDPDRARRCYGETLGLPSRYPDEFETANEPARDGDPFEPNSAGVALRVADVAEAHRRLDETGLEFLGETVDTAFAIWSSAATPRETC